MVSNIARKSAAQRARLRNRKAVRRHGDHTSKCMVWRKENGTIIVGAFPGVSKYDRVGQRAEVEAAVIA